MKTNKKEEIKCYIDDTEVSCITWDKVTHKMNDYPPEMYNEILKDYEWRWGKFNPNMYPVVNKNSDKIDV